jgi:hypothetical protein
MRGYLRQQLEPQKEPKFNAPNLRCTHPLSANAQHGRLACGLEPEDSRFKHFHSYMVPYILAMKVYLYTYNHHDPTVVAHIILQ